MSHPFGDLITQHLHRKHGLSQSKLAAGILQSPSVITDMCQGKRLQGRQARERVVAIITWLQRQGALETLAEANALLAAAGMAALRANDPLEAALLQQIGTQATAHRHSSSITLSTNLPTSALRFSSRNKESAKHNLPAQTTPLIGRAQELAQLAHLLTNPATRLVTILSAGGMGKTHLAIAAALNQVAHFADGVCWVALAPLTEANALVLAIAAALGLQLHGERTPEQQVGDFLRAKHLLLLLDNFEHLLEGAALLTELLAQAPHLSILVTSRQRLKLSSETVVLLEGLRVPIDKNANAVDYPAVALFMQHAQRHHPHDQPAEKDLTGIVQICRLVDGMPLGILLAAAWTGVISPTGIAAEINKDLGFLQTDLHDIPARQRNLRAVFLHTWNRLSNAERTVFMRLSVFRGGATREAAQRVTGASLEVLAALNDKALLWRLPNGRFEIHELLRQFAAEQLVAADADQGETPQQAHCAHSRYYLTLLGEQKQPLQGQHQRAALDLICADFENISVAWRWAVDQHEFALLAPAIQALFLYCEVRGNYRAGLTLFTQATAELQAVSAESVANGLRPAYNQATLQPLLGQMLVRLGACQVMLGDFSHGEQHLQDGLVSVTADQERAFALAYWGVAAAEQGELTLADTRYQESLAISQRGNYVAEMADTLRYLSSANSDLPEACCLAAESLALWRKVGRPDRIANLLGFLAWHLFCSGDYPTATAYWREDLALCEQMDLPNEKAWALDCLGFVAWCQGEMAVAEQFLREALVIYSELGRQSMIGMSKSELALVFSSIGQVEQAVVLAQEAVATTRAVNSQIMLTVSLNYLGAVLLVAGDLVAARHTLLEAIQRAWEHEYFYNLMTAFYYFAELLVQEDKAADLPMTTDPKEFALAVLSCVRTQPATWQIFKDKAAQLQEEIEGALPAQLRATAIARGHSCTLKEMVNAVSGSVDMR